MVRAEARGEAIEGGRTAGAARTLPGDNWLLGTICFATLVGFLLASSLSPFFPLIAADLGVSVALLGQIPALSMLVAASLGLIIGPLADTYGHRRIFLAGTVVVIISAFGTALAPTFGLLLLITLLAALSRAIIQPVALAIAGMRFAGASQRRAMSWVVAAIAGAPVAGVPALTAIGGAFGWRAAFAALGVLAILAAILAAAVLPRERGGMRVPSTARLVFAAYLDLLRHRPSLGLVVASLLRSSAAWGWFNYYSAYLVGERGLTIAQAGWAHAGVGVGLFIGSLLAGGWVAHWPTRPTLIATACLQALALAAPILLGLPVPVVLAMMSFGALTMGISNVTVSLALTRESPVGQATTMTLNQAALSGGRAVGGAVGGGLLVASGYGAIAASVPIFCLAAAAMVWWSCPSDSAPRS